jgi:hypothetical protein
MIFLATIRTTFESSTMRQDFIGFLPLGGACARAEWPPV